MGGKVYDLLIDEGLLDEKWIKRTTFIIYIRKQFGPTHEIHKAIIFPSYALFIEQYGRRHASEQYKTFLATEWFYHIKKTELNSKIPFLFQLMIDGKLHIDEIVPKIQIPMSRLSRLLDRYHTDVKNDLSRRTTDDYYVFTRSFVGEVSIYNRIQHYLAGIKALGLILEGEMTLNEIADSFSDSVIFERCKTTHGRLVYLGKIFQYYFDIGLDQAYREYYGESVFELLDNSRFLTRFRLFYDNDISMFAKNFIRSVAFREYSSIRDLLGPFFPFFP